MLKKPSLATESFVTSKIYLVKSVIKQVVVAVTVILLCVASVFYNIKVLRLYTSRIGHLCFNADNYYNNVIRNRGFVSTLTLIVPDAFIANSDVLQRVASAVPAVVLSGFLGRIGRAVASHRLIHKLSIPFQIIHPEISNVGGSPIWIQQVSENEIESVIKQIKGCYSPYVLLHNRDERYMNNTNNDGNYHKFRNFSFEDYGDTIVGLASQGVCAIRVGAFQEDANVVNLPFIDVSGNSRRKHRPHWDLPLVAGAEFFVSGNSGLAQLSTLLRKPHLYINYIPLRLDHLSSFSCNSLLIPKLLKNRRTKRFLPLSDMMRVYGEWSIHHSIDYFEAKGLEVVNNSPSLIYHAVQEMLMRVRGQWKTFNIEKILQSRAWSIICSGSDFSYIPNTLQIKMSYYFLRQFSDLIR